MNTVNGLVEEACRSSRCVVSVIGDHAGEGIDDIMTRKAGDIRKCGRTFWIIRSRNALPSDVRSLCATGPVYVVFVSPSRRGGSIATSTASAVSQFSPDRESWSYLPSGISDVTGKLDLKTSALVFDMLTTPSSRDNIKLDLWNYSDFKNPSSPLKLIQGASTVCALRKDMRSHPDKLKSPIRNVVAVARLVDPYCVWVR